jgi:hypothetical protein
MPASPWIYARTATLGRLTPGRCSFGNPGRNGVETPLLAHFNKHPVDCRQASLAQVADTPSSGGPSTETGQVHHTLGFCRLGYSVAALAFFAGPLCGEELPHDMAMGAAAFEKAEVRSANRIGGAGGPS